MNSFLTVWQNQPIIRVRKRQIFLYFFINVFAGVGGKYSMEGKRLTSYAMEELECPKCGHKHSLKKYKVINVTEKAKLKEEIIKEKGWIQISDEGAIKEVVMKILEANPQSVADFKAGKDRALGFLVGQAMKETKGKANPKMLNEMFLAELNK